MVSNASDDLPDPESPVKTTSLSLGIDRVTFLRLCSRAPRIVMCSVVIEDGHYSFSLVTANVALAVATSRPPGVLTWHSVTIVLRPAWTTRPVARSVSPTLAAEMKFSLRSKLIARATPGFTVRSERPMAESASVLIMPPCTNPAWFAISATGVISTVAVPSPSSTSLMPSQRQAGDATGVSLTALALRHRHAGRRRAGDQAVRVVEHVRLAEQQRLPHFDHAADGPQAAGDEWAEEVDLQLDRGVPHAVFLERRQ